jgi:hypothetical protein
LEEIVAAPVKKTKTNDRGDPQHPLSANVGTTLPTSGGRSVGRYSSLADQSHKVFFFGILENTTFRKLDLFPSSGGRHLLC